MGQFFCVVNTYKKEPDDQPGGGIQYELPANIKQLVKHGYLQEIN